ncbi:MAG: ferrous iron transport protein A [Bacteriovoracaceae bacterium]|jgi:Fe2+ transport system protein FeoA|nr:ferrous iron transport protein A [Bacteriovoracaceae bacterium]
MKNASIIEKNNIYTIDNILSGDEAVVTRLWQLGVLPESSIKLVKRAPLFRDPLLFEVDGMCIALTRGEASLITVKES